MVNLHQLESILPGDIHAALLRRLRRLARADVDGVGADVERSAHVTRRRGYLPCDEFQPGVLEDGEGQVGEALLEQPLELVLVVRVEGHDGGFAPARGEPREGHLHQVNRVSDSDDDAAGPGDGWQAEEFVQNRLVTFARRRHELVHLVE